MKISVSKNYRRGEKNMNSKCKQDKKLREISFSPTASVVCDSLPPKERARVQGVLDVLKNPSSMLRRNYKFFQSKQHPDMRMAKVSPNLRLFYHQEAPDRICVDDIMQKDLINALAGGPKKMRGL
ncbi:MAG: hypothetical protein NTX50_06855 [Candidatus Sumerlaeota bacterium]|nr:hypothetical protein [Candidatus Sumerlaeota bacterium]